MLIALGVIKAETLFDKIEFMRANWHMVCDVYYFVNAFITLTFVD